MDGALRLLAQSGANVAINYVVNEAAAKSTLAKVREKGGDGFIIQADVTSQTIFATCSARCRPNLASSISL
ncbi:MAG: hypothetical protein R2867_30670 [Caldilineaceae bacterium]